MQYDSKMYVRKGHATQPLLFENCGGRKTGIPCAVTRFLRKVTGYLIVIGSWNGVIIINVGSMDRLRKREWTGAIRLSWDSHE